MMWRRRKSVVRLRQQIWFGLEVVFVAIGFVILCAFFMFVPPMSAWFTDIVVSYTLLDDMIQTIYLQWPWVMLSMAVLFAIGVIMAHRLFGPVRGLENVLRAWSMGDRSARVRFRKYDYLLGVQDALNKHFDAQARLMEKAKLLAKDASVLSGPESVRKTAMEFLALCEPKKE